MITHPINLHSRYNFQDSTIRIGISLPCLTCKYIVQLYIAYTNLLMTGLKKKTPGAKGMPSRVKKSFRPPSTDNKLTGPRPAGLSGHVNSYLRDPGRP